MSRLCISAHTWECLVGCFIAATKVFSGVCLDIWVETGLPLWEMAGELFEVTGWEADLFSPHLQWVKNLNLLSLSVNVNKTDGDQGTWRLGRNKSCTYNTTTLWMKRRKYHRNTEGVYISSVILSNRWVKCGYIRSGYSASQKCICTHKSVLWDVVDWW